MSDESVWPDECESKYQRREVLGKGSFGQVFNPSWVGGTKPGLLVRTQNCTPLVGKCVRCSGNGSAASVLTFSAQQHNRKGGSPTYAPLTRASVVFGPHDTTDDLGTEDPRVTFDASSGTFYMFYTCYNSGATPHPRVTLCLATTVDPSSAIGWVRRRTLNARCTLHTHPASAPHAHRMHRCVMALLASLLALNRARCC